MIFDSTDEIMPPGYLPDYEQDSLALVLAGDSGALLQMPVTPPPANRVERAPNSRLMPKGGFLPRHASTLTASARMSKQAGSSDTAGS
jgi:hypothetical protein